MATVVQFTRLSTKLNRLIHSGFYKCFARMQQNEKSRESSNSHGFFNFLNQ
jgi:hypothetical protein